MDRIKQDLGLSRTTLATRVVDAERGTAAAGLHLTITAADGHAVSGRTDADGRAAVPAGLAPGTATIVYETGPWFEAQERATFFPEVRIQVTLTSGRSHGIELVLSPFSYTTYQAP
jgi:5-hydroxyisourate hydrolase